MFINSSCRILYGSLAALLILSAPAYAQGHGGSRPPSQSSSAHPGQSTPQSQPGHPQSAPPSSGIKTYPGQDSYRSGVRPPEVQQRYDAPARSFGISSDLPGRTALRCPPLRPPARVV